VALLQELDQRSGLHTAMKNRGFEKLRMLLEFLQTRASSTKYRNTLYKVLDVVTDMYGELINVDQRLRGVLAELYCTLNDELELQEKCLKLDGMIDVATKSQEPTDN
jgi:hypothetical protein